MFDVHVERHVERWRELRDEADRERLVRQARQPHRQWVHGARQTLGRGLVNLGRQLAND